MASRSSTSSSAAVYFLFATVLFTVLSYNPAAAQLVSVNAISVSGLLVCSATGNLTPTCRNCLGIAGANVTVTCNGATTTVAQAITNASGFFNALLPIAGGFLFGSSSPVPCTVTVALPVASCTLLPRSGLLQAPVNVVGNLIGGVLGSVLQAVRGVFTIVPVRLI